MKETNTLIGPSILIRADLRGDEDLTVLGRVEGTISLSKTLIVEPSGVVKADIDVKNAIVAGTVVGNITASQSVEITHEGRMVGDIAAPRVIIVDGASFRGKIDMGSPDEEGERPKASRPSKARASQARRPSFRKPTSRSTSSRTQHTRPSEPKKERPAERQMPPVQEELPELKEESPAALEEAPRERPAVRALSWRTTRPPQEEDAPSEGASAEVEEGAEPTEKPDGEGQQQGE